MTRTNLFKDHLQRVEAWIWDTDIRSAPIWERVILRTLRILVAVIRDLRDGQLSLRAMSLVYNTVIAIVPLLALSFSVLKGFGMHNEVEPALLEALEAAPVMRIEDLKRANTMFQRVTAAYELLNDPRARAELGVHGRGTDLTDDEYLLGFLTGHICSGPPGSLAAKGAPLLQALLTEVTLRSPPISGEALNEFVRKICYSLDAARLLDGPPGAHCREPAIKSLLFSGKSRNIVCHLKKTISTKN